MAIGIRVKKAPEDYDLGASKFFGTPTVPLAWQDAFYEDELFFCQIRLEDIATLDRENRLPHTGYLYIFIHTGDSAYDLRADVKYCEEEPELAIDEFNATLDEYEHLTVPYLMEFFESDSDEGTHLLGDVCDWNYEDAPPRLLMQYDPLDADMNFLDYLDGFLYFFFGDDESDLSKVTLHEEFS